MSDYDEIHLYGTDWQNPETDKDTDDDGVDDGEDGWPHCNQLAPARLTEPNYVVVPIHVGSSSMHLTIGEINNSANTLFTTNEGGVIAHYYFNWSESGPQLLPPVSNSAGLDSNNDYFGLTDQNYFLRDGIVVRTLDGDDSLPALFLDGNLQFEISKLIEFPPPLNGEDDQLANAYVNLVLPSGRVRGRQDGHWNRPYEAPIEWDATGQPFAMTDSFDFETEYVVYSSAVNALGVGLADAERLNEITNSGWDEFFGVWNSVDDSFIILKTVSAIDWGNYDDYPEESQINNKNTITTSGNYGVRLWVDKRTGIRNDQATNANLTAADLEVIDWNEKWGDPPPVNLNTEMRGFDTTRIWQNAQWLEIQDLVPAAKEPNPQWSNIQIKDINDSGTCIAQATNSDGKKCAVLLLKVEFEEATPYTGFDDNDDQITLTSIDTPAATVPSEIPSGGVVTVSAGFPDFTEVVASITEQGSAVEHELARLYVDIKPGISDTRSIHIFNVARPGEAIPNGRTPAEIKTFLDQTWGAQANVYFTMPVQQADRTLDYDSNGVDGLLVGNGSYMEIQSLTINTLGDSGDINVFFVEKLEARGNALGFHFIEIGKSYIFIEAGQDIDITAHEFGHALGLNGVAGEGHSLNQSDVMAGKSPSTPRRTQIRRSDWNVVNPVSP